MKFCKDCIHKGYEKNGFYTDRACALEVGFGLVPDPVDGKLDYPGDGWMCSRVRRDTSKCGPDAKWFSPKPIPPPSIIKRIIARFKQ